MFSLLGTDNVAHFPTMYRELRQLVRHRPSSRFLKTYRHFFNFVFSKGLPLSENFENLPEFPFSKLLK